MNSKFKKGFVDLLAIGLVALVALTFSIVSYEKSRNTPQIVAGSYNPTGGGTYRLQSSIGTSNTSITLTSFKEPVSNIPYTMSYLNSTIEYATIDPQTTYKEFISFTGITQNADGTATLTGVSRGLGFSYPYTASTTLAQSHSGQSILILSNPPQLTNQYGNKNNAELITGSYWGFTNPPYLINSATSTSQVASVGYVNGIAFGTSIIPASLGGTGNSSNPLNMLLVGNAGSAIVSTSSPTVGYITSTSTTLSNFAGDIDARNINTTGITSTIASSTTYIANVGTLNATSTIKINGTSLANYSILSISTGSLGSTNTATTTVKTYTIPANTFGVNKMLRISASFTEFANGSSGDCHFGVDFGNGSASTTLASPFITGSTDEIAFANATIFSTSTNAQVASGNWSYQDSGLINDNAVKTYFGTFRPTYNTAAQLYIAYNVRATVGKVCSLQGESIELLQ